ncbi:MULTISPECIES: hypothetical protein [unclassified Ruegeria]|uniref:hypothetical protein n=1 Tax=unclassified Ruegeria TaxID=2625375 RepID=UPI0014878548|nr:MULTISPECIES: hypothetical protein [unclassified Ruegeria]
MIGKLKILFLAIATLCILGMISSSTVRYRNRTNLEERIRNYAIELVQTDSFLVKFFPPPHSLADVYQLRKPFFNATWAIAPLEQISEFSKRNQSRVNGDVHAIILDNWTKDDTAILFTLKDCGGFFCELDNSDLQVVPRSDVTYILRSGNPKVNRTIRSDGYQTANITPDFASKKDYLVTAQIIRNNGGDIVEIFVFYERPASSFESFVQSFTGDPHNRHIAKKRFFHYNYALQWSVEY